MTEKKEIQIKGIGKEIRSRLRAEFPAEAMSSIPGKEFLTSIKAIYIVERLNDCFGIGKWNHSVEIIANGDDHALVLGTLLVPEFEIKISQFGGGACRRKNANPLHELGDTFKSAMTDSLTKCASYLEVGIDVFKGNAPTARTTAPTFTPPAPDYRPNPKTYASGEATPTEKQIAYARRLIAGIEDDSKRNIYKKRLDEANTMNSMSGLIEQLMNAKG